MRTVQRAEPRKRRQIVLVGVIVVAAFAGAAFLLTENQGRRSPVAPPSSPSAPAARDEGTARAPNFTLETIDGASFTLAAQRGNVVRVNFLAAGG